jgi:hypothetical protein
MLDSGCVAACEVVGPMVKSMSRALQTEAKFDTHPANEGAYCENRVADIPS